MGYRPQKNVIGEGIGPELTPVYQKPGSFSFKLTCMIITPGPSSLFLSINGYLAVPGPQQCSGRPETERRTVLVREG